MGKARPTRLTILLVLMLVITATSSPTVKAQNEAESCNTAVINAVATVGMIADVVSNVGGDCVTVAQLMGAGVDPHLYRATESDVFTLLDAHVIFYGGLHLEGRMADIFEELAKTRPTVAVSESIPEAHLLTEPGFNQIDPHVWMDVQLWMYTVGTVRDELTALDPEHEAFYSANAESYLAQLEELDSYIREQIQRVPEQQRVLVTAHDAFQYFGRAYDIEVFAPQGITTATEAGVEDIRRTIDLIAERQIPAIFVESSVPPDIIEAIIEGARARGQAISIGGQLFSDAMGDAGTPEGTYIGMIRHNAETISAALLGENTSE